MQIVAACQSSLGAVAMRDRDIEPLELRDFLIMAALMAAVLVILWGTASAIVKARHNFDGPPVVAR
ncbi:hypothetical protein CU102_00715 [Phyllobacterium brassicacearum]|uniref:Uncharacterized protein n=2 Tax=Phyllobacterium brassicacearum TaxID=314235 RepID=A0A2P7BVY7_9HYPH|nr:hypothetical protein CU102_00715 [Phyllobacterium brassicacearum]